MRTRPHVTLRPTVEDDLDVIYAQQSDREAQWMAAFIMPELRDETSFRRVWKTLLHQPGIVAKIILADDEIAGVFMQYEEGERTEVSYWIGKSYWGQGIATECLTNYVTKHNLSRPLYARVAADNVASLRVLQKCGFSILSSGIGHALARNGMMKEHLLILPPACHP